MVNERDRNDMQLGLVHLSHSRTVDLQQLSAHVLSMWNITDAANAQASKR